MSLAFSPDGQTLASGNKYGAIYFWDTVTGDRKNAFDGHTDEVFALAFSPDGQTLASGSSDGTVRLWDVRSGSPLQTLRGHTDSVTSVVFSPDGATLASGSLDRTLCLPRSLLPMPKGKRNLKLNSMSTLMITTSTCLLNSVATG